MDRSNDADFMKGYLYHAMTFERYVYVWNQALKSSNKAVAQIKSQRENCEAGLRQTRNQLFDIDDNYFSAKENSRNQKNKAKKNIALVIGFSAALLILLVIGVVLIISDVEAGALLMLPFMTLSGLVPFILILFFFKIFKSKNDEKRYTDSRKDYEKERLSNDIKNYETSIQVISSKENAAVRQNDEIRKNLNYALSIRNKIYSLNVLDESYRSLVATATLYQYLKSGVCTSVKGVGGIYQTYLYHSQLNNIVTKLSEISEKLDIVISNQRTLYDEMIKANGTLNSIEKEVKEINGNVSDIKHNSEISAQANCQTADASRYMAYVAWRNS